MSLCKCVRTSKDNDEVTSVQDGASPHDLAWPVRSIDGSDDEFSWQRQISNRSAVGRTADFDLEFVDFCVAFEEGGDRSCAASHVPQHGIG